MRVAIRVDSSAFIGSGHLMRCLTLANELRSRDVHVVFICRELPGNLIYLLEKHNYFVHHLLKPSVQLNNADNPYLSWLGVSINDDAEESLACIADIQYDWIIVDHYGLDFQWENRMRQVAKRILVIDDLANRTHDCNVLLDQNYFAENTTERYKNKVNASCQCLLGPSYALLQPEYANSHDVTSIRNGIISKIVVFFGATDQHNQTSKVLQALACDELAHISVDVILGANNPHADSIKDLVKHHSSVMIYKNLPSLFNLMRAADLAIGAGGATTWERMCLGVPSLVISLAENQQEFTKILADHNFHVALADGVATTSMQWRQAIIQLVNNPDFLLQLSFNSKKLVDGMGVKRICNMVINEILEIENITPYSV